MPLTHSTCCHLFLFLYFFTYYLNCHVPTYQVKFFLCANLLGNKFDSDSDSKV